MRGKPSASSYRTLAIFLASEGGYGGFMIEAVRIWVDHQARQIEKKFYAKKRI